MIEFTKQDIKTAKERRAEMMDSQKIESDCHLSKIIDSFNKVDSSTGRFCITIISKASNSPTVPFGDYNIVVDDQLNYSLYQNLVKLSIEFHSLGYKLKGLNSSSGTEFLGYAAVCFLFKTKGNFIIEIQW